MKVLIIHRQLNLLLRLKEKFISGGWLVHTSDNGLDGLLAARHYAFDLVLCGFDLPVVSGTEIVRALRMLSPNTKTPVFFFKKENEFNSHLELARQLKAKMINEEEFEFSLQVNWLTNSLN